MHYVYLPLVLHTDNIRIPLIDFCLALERPVREVLFYPYKDFRLRGWGRLMPIERVTPGAAHMQIRLPTATESATPLGRTLVRLDVADNALIILGTPLDKGAKFRTAPLRIKTLRQHHFDRGPTLFLVLRSMDHSRHVLLGLDADWVSAHATALRHLERHQHIDLGAIDYAICDAHPQPDNPLTVLSAWHCPQRQLRRDPVILHCSEGRVSFAVGSTRIYHTYAMTHAEFIATLNSVCWCDDRFRYAQRARQAIENRYLRSRKSE